MQMIVDANVQWHLVCSSEETTSDEPTVRKIESKQIAIYKLDDGKFSAVSDICTHQYASLSNGFLEGDTIECPLHQACFDIRTGKCHGPTATVDLEVFPLKIEDGKIYVGIRK